MKHKETSKTKADHQEQVSSQLLVSELQSIIEAALFASREPLSVRNMLALFPADARPDRNNIQNVLLRLGDRCKHRGVELRRVGKGWRFQSKLKYSPWLRKLDAQKPPKYSRALLETLAIIAYRQPVTRGDIEDIRGVRASGSTMHTLRDRGWIQQLGHRDVPGRPALFGTTQIFLEYFNLTSLQELPELMKKRELGDIAKDMNLTLPMDGVHHETESSRQSEVDSSAEIIKLRVSDDSKKNN